MPELAENTEEKLRQIRESQEAARELSDFHETQAANRQSGFNPDSVLQHPKPEIPGITRPHVPQEVEQPKDPVDDLVAGLNRGEALEKKLQDDLAGKTSFNAEASVDLLQKYMESDEEEKSDPLSIG
jgi:hypothetical protein